MNVRSRLEVAKQIDTGKKTGLFAATPLLEALRMLLLMSNDRAYARTASDMYVELCKEDKTEPGDEHRCGNS